MPKPSQSKERLRRAIHNISPNTQPDIPPMKKDIPVIKPANIKDSYGQIIIIVLAIIGFLVIIFTAIAWHLNWI
ncbi:MAG: hypothetical protein P1P90_03680 [Patescibacteria group bacterium]|nr:hypothetical protein [Patescibacteria group bacterium]